jgi:serine protease AprX
MRCSAPASLGGQRALSLITAALFLFLSAWTPVDPPTPRASPQPAATTPQLVTARAWTAAADSPADMLVQIAGYPDLSAARALSGKTAKTRFVYESLSAHAAKAQGPLLASLRARGLSAHSLWISNQIWVRSVRQADLLWLSQQSGVARVDLDVTFNGLQTAPPKTAPPARATRPQAAARNSPQAIEWGVARVRAPEVWALGYNGQDIVVADLDTGVRWDHPALLYKYRGWNGITATHNYNWYDAAGHSIASPQLTPFDDNGHGTHTTGTLIGDDGAGNQIGVAPGAQWIGCRNMLFNVGSVARYTACFQFALAPTDVNGLSPNPALAADITNNSWGCSPPITEVGCEIPTALVTVTQSLRDAGIMVVASAGNNGSGCSTVAAAPATLDQAFTAGATDSSNAIAGFSSRGPSTLSGRVKPDLVAPGASVRSSRGAGYMELSGTSMAAPHVAGVAALLWSAIPELRGEVSETEDILRRTAQFIPGAQECGGVPGSARPNNVYGHGLIDAYAALSEALRLRDRLQITMPDSVAVSEPITYQVRYTNTSSDTILNNVTITVSLPLSTSFISASGGAILSGTLVTWMLGSFVPGASTEVALSVSSAYAGLVTLDNVRFSDSSISLGEPRAVTLVYGTHQLFPLVLR